MAVFSSDLKLKVETAMKADQDKELRTLFREMMDILQQTSFTDLAADEQKLFADAYEKIAMKLLSKWRKAESDEVKKIMDSQLRALTNDVIYTLIEILISRSEQSEAKILYLKMLGDSYYYLVEITKGSESENASTKCSDTYQRGLDLAILSLAPNNPLRLQMALNYSRFLYNVANHFDRATKMVTNTYKDAEAAFGAITEETNLLIQRLQERYRKWTEKSALPKEENH